MSAPIPYGDITLTDSEYDVVLVGGMSIADGLAGVVSQIEIDAEEGDDSAPLLRVIDGQERVVFQVQREGDQWTSAELDTAMTSARHLDRAKEH